MQMFFNEHINKLLHYRE